jgi:hypothetical protein
MDPHTILSTRYITGPVLQDMDTLSYVLCWCFSCKYLYILYIKKRKKNSLYLLIRVGQSWHKLVSEVGYFPDQLNFCWHSIWSLDVHMSNCLHYAVLYWLYMFQNCSHACMPVFKIFKLILQKTCGNMGQNRGNIQIENLVGRWLPLVCIISVECKYVQILSSWYLPVSLKPFPILLV